MIEGVISKIEKRYNKTFLPIITGGYSESIAPSVSRECVIDPMLTMKGIKYIYNLNSKL